MFKTFHSKNLQDSYKKILYELMTEGLIESPRGMETREFTPAVFQIDDPRSRLLTLSTRKMNIFYAVMETLWYMNGDDSVERLTPYNKAMANFSDDGQKLTGAYGKRLFDRATELDKSQFGLVYDKLKADPSSRQALAIIWDPWRDHKPTKDVPCTVGFMFTIRDEKLNMTTIMRSNDIVWGTTYDVFAFTIFQEFLARKLGVGLGTYTHFANSLHIYKAHYDMAWDMIRDNTEPSVMFDMPDTKWDTFTQLYKFEKQVSEDPGGALHRLYTQRSFGSYWNAWADLLLLHRAIKQEKWSMCHRIYANIPMCYRPLLTHWREKFYDK